MRSAFQSRSVELTAQQQVIQVASDQSVHRAFEWLRVRENKLRELQMEVAAIPAPPFGEQKRAEWLRERFTELELQDVEIDQIGNVVAVRPGSAAVDDATDRSAKAVAVTAHLDTVFPEGTNVQPSQNHDKLYGPGISDNAAGITALLALASALRHALIKTAAEIIFIGNVGEEGEGDLRGMRHIFSQERWRERIGYTVVLDGTGTDSIICEALGSRRYEVTVRGPGGHSWSDFGIPNPIVILSRAIASFSAIQVPSSPKTTFNIGNISGGTSVNSIPQSATIRVDIRSTQAEELSRVEAAMQKAFERAVAESSGEGHKVSFEMKQIGERPAAELSNEARILEIIRAVDSHLRISSSRRRASTDANIPLSLGLEAISIGAGGLGGGAHTLQEWYDPRGRDLGLKRILLTVLALSGIQ
jgi:tripeptide aminopeptidase